MQRMRWVGRAGVAVALLLLVGCGGRRGRVGVQTALTAADDAFRPGEPGFEDEVQRLLDEAAGEGPEGPEILWRRARLAVARGQASADPVAARSARQVWRDHSGCCSLHPIQT